MHSVRSTLLVLLSLTLCGCDRPESSACSGLVYKESGLKRKEYLPCAAAMVAELDHFHQELSAMGNRSLPMNERQKARQGCVASNGRLGRLIRQAGGPEKLANVSWDDAALNRMNYNIIAA